MGTIKPVACLILTLILAAAAAAQQSTKPTHQQTSDSGSEAQNGSVRGRVVLPSGAQVSEPVMLDGTRLDELERRLGLPVLALDFEGFAEIFRGRPSPAVFHEFENASEKMDCRRPHR